MINVKHVRANDDKEIFGHCVCDDGTVIIATSELIAIYDGEFLFPPIEPEAECKWVLDE